MVTVRRRRDGRYEARIMYQGRRFSVYGRSENEVRTRLAALERQLALDQPPPPGMTVKQLCERWLATEGRRWKPRTLSDYQRLLERWVYPAIGSVRLSRLTPDRLQRLFDAIPGRAASQTYQVLRRCFTLAVRWGFLSQNPCARLSPPIYRASKVELPDSQSLVRLFRHCLETDDNFAPLIGLTLLTGWRLGEALSLRWSDVDLTTGEVKIARSGQWVGGVWTETPPKTRAGHRVIPLGEVGVRLLRRQKSVVAQKRLAAGPTWQDHDLVFPNSTGKPLSSDRVSAALRRLCHQSGVPRLHFHALRHGMASLLISAGVPLGLVSSRLGHADVAITARVYIHALSDGRTAAKAIEQILSG